MVLEVGYSKEELKLRLIDKLSNEGITKSQLRSKLYAELSLQTSIKAYKESSHLLLKVIDSMFVEYLKERELEFTLSVFLPESGLLSVQKSFTRQDMIQALHLDRKHDLEQDKSLLTTLFDKKTRYFDLNTSDQQCQTNVEIDDLMHMKIRDIDNTVRTNKIDYDTRQINQLEQRLLSCQREIEEQSKKQVEQQIETFKTIELTRLKIQAKKETQIQLDRQQSLFEEKLLSFESQHISNLEQERKRMLDREREMDRNNLFLKQSLLDENNKLMFKEKELRNESDLIAKQFELERDLLKNQVQQYQNQVHSLNEFKERYAQKMEESIASYKINLNKEHFQSKSDLEVEKTKLLGERTNLEAMMLKVRKSENYKSEAKDLEQKLDQMTKDRDEQMIKFKDIQLKLLTQQNQSSFEFELTSLKRQLLEQEKGNHLRQDEYEKLIKDLMAPKQTFEEEYKKSLQNEKQWRKQCEDLVEKLDAEFLHSDELERRFENERMKTKELENQVAELKSLLNQAQNALSLSERNAPSYSHLKSGFSEKDRLHDRYQYLTNKSIEKSKIPHPSLYEEYIHEIRPPTSLVFRDEFASRSEKYSPSKTAWKPEYAPKRKESYSPTKDWKDELLTTNDREYLKTPRATSIPEIVDKYQSKIPLVPSMRHVSPKRESQSDESSEKINLVRFKSDETSEKHIDTPTIIPSAEMKSENNIVRFSVETEPPAPIAVTPQKAEIVDVLMNNTENVKFDLDLENERRLRIEKEQKDQESLQRKLKEDEEAKQIQQEKQKDRLKQEAEISKQEKLIRQTQQEEVSRLKELEAGVRAKQLKEALEEKRLKEEQQKKKDELDSIDQLAKDPMMLKYMQIVNEKRGVVGKNEAKADERKSSSDSFGIGGTEDEMSAPGGDSSSGPSW